MSFILDTVHHDCQNNEDDACGCGQTGQCTLHAAGFGLTKKGIRTAGDGAGHSLTCALLQQNNDGQEYTDDNFHNGKRELHSTHV